MQMQLDDVLVFLQIASSGSLTAAARIRCKPKASISHQLRRLEDDLGVQLFIRSKNSLELSPAGISFLEHAKKIKRVCESSMDAATRNQEELAGTMRIGTSGEFTSNLVGPIIKHFAKRYPKVKIELMVLRGDALLSASDSLDCMIYLDEPPMPQASELTAKLLGRFTYALFASAGYLEEHGTPSRPEELQDHALIGFHTGESTFQWRIESAERDFVLNPSTVFRSNDYWVVKLAAIQDHGICLLPNFFADMERDAGLLERVMPDWQSKNIPMYALFQSHRISNPRLRALIDAIADNFRDTYTYLYTASR